MEGLVQSADERTSVHLRAQILLLDWLIDGRWEAEETAPATPPTPTTSQDYMAHDNE